MSQQKLREEITKVRNQLNALSTLDAEAQAKLIQLNAAKRTPELKIMASELKISIAKRATERHPLKTRFRYLNDEMERLVKVCEWERGDDGVWETACGEDFSLDEGTLKENGMRFCCFCGGRIK